MKMKVYQCETDEYIKMEVIGKYKYIGEDKIDVRKGREYYRVKKENSEENEFRIVDESNEDYLYPEKDFVKIK